jgi:protein ImuB
MERLLAVWVPALGDESPDGATLRTYLTLLDALSVLCPFTEPVRLGLYALPVRGPSRFFGGEGAVLDAVATTVADVTSVETRLGVADGLFCAELAARRAVVVPAGATEAFRRAQPLDVLGRKDLATTCRRLGLHTVGAFADLDAARVAERFDGHALHLHQVARGEVGELSGQRDARLAARLARLRGETGVLGEQRGFFGQRGAGDDRAEAAAHRIRRRLGADAVVVASLRGGRGPGDRAALVPWGSPEARRDDAPWPGQLGAPLPATTLAHPVAVELRDDADEPVRVSARGLLSGLPAVAVLARARHEVVWYAGPWPIVERWWAAARRRAHLQVVLDTGAAVLLVAESGRWWLTGIYD